VPKFSKSSLSKLETCHDDLQKVFKEVIKHVDCTIIEGHRGEERQNKLCDEGKSKVRFPNGRHNASPSCAVDVMAYPIDWDDRERNTLFAGYVIGLARGMGVTLRWGGDWDSDFNLKENFFDDHPHFELK
tara:strand:+ start:7320 stop:7709 length:390 start_codon:yes stop_codon:yes gene_type:complete